MADTSSQQWHFFFILTLHTHTHISVYIDTHLSSLFGLFFILLTSQQLCFGYRHTKECPCVFDCVVRGNLFSHTSNNSSICFVIHWNTWMTFSLFYFYFFFYKNRIPSVGKLKMRLCRCCTNSCGWYFIPPIARSPWAVSPSLWEAKKSLHCCLLVVFYPPPVLIMHGRSQGGVSWLTRLYSQPFA